MTTNVRRLYFSCPQKNENITEDHGKIITFLIGTRGQAEVTEKQLLIIGN